MTSHRIFAPAAPRVLPKIAVRKHGQVVANAWMTSRMLGPALNKDSVLFYGFPLFHVNAVIITGLVPFFVGASVLLGTSGGYRARDLISQFWEAVEQHRVTAFSAVPTLLVSLNYAQREMESEGFEAASDLKDVAVRRNSPATADAYTTKSVTCRAWLFATRLWSEQ